MFDSKDIQEAVDVLNSALNDDKEAITSLVENRVPCNNKLADHPTVQVSGEDDNFRVGLLGIVNGIFGCDGNNRGFIGADYDDDDNLIKFVVLKEEGEPKFDNICLAP